MTTELMLFLMAAIVLVCMIGKPPGGKNVTKGPMKALNKPK